MKIARLSCLTLLSLALFGCDQTAKKTPPTTAIKAREPVIALALGGGGAKGFAHIGVIKVLEAQGIQSPSGCRMGICNTCACAKTSGSTRHLPSGALEHEASSALKLCISSAASDLELDL